MRIEDVKNKVPLLLVVLITLPTGSANIFCFCNSPSCLGAVCESNQRCFTRLVKNASADGNLSTSIVYGCSEALNSTGSCLKSALVICCDTQLCNMPNMLRKRASLLARRYSMATTHAPMIREKAGCKCASLSPAMRVASVAAPSVLILTVILSSFAMCHKMSRYHKRNNITKEIESNAVGMSLPFTPLGGSMGDSDVPATFRAGKQSTGSCSYHTLITSPNSVWDETNAGRFYRKILKTETTNSLKQII